MESILGNMLFPIKLSFILRYLAGMVLFSWRLPKQRNYGARLAVWSALCIAVTVFLPVMSDRLEYVTTLFLVEALMSMGLVKFCCRTDWPVVFYIASAAFSAEHIASMIDSLFAMLRPDVLSYVSVLHLTVPMVLNWAFVAAVVYAVLYQLMFREKHIAAEHNLNFSVTVPLLIASLFVNLYLNLIYSNLLEEKTLWVTVFEYGFNLLCSGLLLFAQAGMMRESQMEKRLQMVSMLWEQAREQYRVSKENIEAINIKCHDLKHQLLAFKDRTNESEYARLLELVDSYGAEIETNNEVLDVVFQEKNFQCRKLGIQFTCIIDGAALNFMDTTDLYVLFGNLIDNCIEAVSRLPETDVKNVQVSVRKNKGFVIVATENGYAGKLRWVNGRLRTSKADTENHGFGILSIERIIKKYNGRYSMSTEDHIFSMNIVFPIGANPS